MLALHRAGGQDHGKVKCTGRETEARNILSLASTLHTQSSFIICALTGGV